MMEPERNGRLRRGVESCGTPCTGESMDNSGVYGVAVSVSDELEACKTVQMGDDLTISALGSSTIVGEESSASYLAPSSFVLGLGVPEQIPLAHPVPVDDTYDDALYRRVNDGSVIFVTGESHTTSNVGLFKTIKGNSDLSSPIQNQNPDLTLLPYPEPRTESCHVESTLPVFQKLKVKHLCIEGTTLTLCEEMEDVDYKHPYRDTDWHKGPCIGSGASGTCFLYTNRCSDHVVLKQVRVCAKNRAKLECEVDMMSSIQHKNIIQFITANEVHGYFNIVMEYMAGGSLEGRIKKGPLSEDLIFDFTKQTMSGLSYLHEKQIAHRDVKGANLLLDSIERNLCLADFGEAARLSDIEKFHTMAGTPPFMAPEVVRAKPTNRRYSQKCDVWSTGCVMIEMGTRHIPWMLNNFKYERWTILYKIGTTCTPPPMPKFQSKVLQEIMVHCLRVDQDERPSSGQLYNHLLHF